MDRDWVKDQTRQIYSLTNIQTDKHTERQIYRLTDNQTNGKQTEVKAIDRYQVKFVQKSETSWLFSRKRRVNTVNCYSYNFSC